jgi:hypothetical protein
VRCGYDWTIQLWHLQNSDERHLNAQIISQPYAKFSGGAQQKAAKLKFPYFCRCVRNGRFSRPGLIRTPTAKQNGCMPALQPP